MTRNLAICIVPTVIALLAIYWFRKKKKIKCDKLTFPCSANIIKKQDENNLKVTQDCASDLDNTLSDASSFASPINSEKSWVESPLYTSPSQDVSEDSLQNLSNCADTLDEDILLKKTNDFYKYKDLQNDISNIDIENIKAESIKYKDLQHLVSENLISTKNLHFLKNDDKCLSFVKRNVYLDGEGIETSKEKNHSDDLSTVNEYVNNDQHSVLLQDTEKDSIKVVSPCLEELEKTVDLDSQSSVFDENSLSYVSDDSEGRHLSECNNKDSLSSILDESSSLSNFCEELEKSANSQVSPTIASKQAHDASDNSKNLLSLTPLKALTLLLEQGSNNINTAKELNNYILSGKEIKNGPSNLEIETSKIENALVTSTINSTPIQIPNDFSDCLNTKSTSPSNSDSAIQSGDDTALRTVIDNIFADFNSSLPTSAEDNLICNSPNSEGNHLFSVISKQKENSVTIPALDEVNSNHGYFLNERVPPGKDSKLDSTDSELKDSCNSTAISNHEITNHLDAAANVVQRITSDFNSSLSILLEKNSAWNSPNLKSNMKWSPPWTKCESSSELKSSSVLPDVTLSAKDVCDIKSSIMLPDKSENNDSNISSTVSETDESKNVNTVSVGSPSNSSGFEGNENHVKVTKQIQKEINGISDVKVPSNEFVYEFELPQELCGRLIGRHGRHVKSIMERSNANVFIKRHPYDPLLKVVVVEGLRSDVNDALEIIRRKYPPAQYPTVTLLQTNVIGSTGVPLPESLQLHLPEGASCDVILSSLVHAGHFFLQQPTHPTYPSLSTLDQCMINLYSQMDTPLLPQPIEAGVICAAPVYRGWYRAQVVYICDNSTDCGIKFVDYGGFSQVPISSLRQIRSDFMSLPFQASECYLAHVRPVGGESWSSEATSTFEELAQGQILQALLVEYAEDGIPCVYLYRVQGVSSTFINKELVERGLAVWVNSNHWDPH